jgi:hypothetical protein
MLTIIKTKWLTVTMLASLLALMVPSAPCADEDDEFYGTVETLPSTSGWVGDWTVSGRTVRVNAKTRIDTEDGPLAPGVRVEIQGTELQDGTFQAAEVEVERDRDGSN